jgi:predicted PurR-regulated permease PerM
VVRQSHRQREAEAPEPEVSVSPWDIQSATLLAIFGVLFLWVLYFARDILMPITFAFVLSLLLQPAMRGLTRLHIPKPISALLILLAFFGCLAGFFFAVSGPATGWISKAPEALPQLEQRLSVLKKPITMLQELLDRIQQLTQASSGEIPVQMKGSGLSELFFGGTHILASFGVTMVLLFYLLVAGDLFLRRLVEILPDYRNKKQVVMISREIERNISQYLMTISLMNIAVGIATGITAYICGLPDPVLWGTGAFLLNYIMILGPLGGVGILLVVGFLSSDSLLRALLPAGLYLCIHVAEGEFITPMLLARRFTLNQVLVILSLIFWFWMWGIAGALLAVPLLAMCKIMCDHIESLTAVGHFIGGDNHSS